MQACPLFRRARRRLRRAVPERRRHALARVIPDDRELVSRIWLRTTAPTPCRLLGRTLSALGRRISAPVHPSHAESCSVSPARSSSIDGILDCRSRRPWRATWTVCARRTVPAPEFQQQYIHGPWGNVSWRDKR